MVFFLTDTVKLQVVFRVNFDLLFQNAFLYDLKRKYIQMKFYFDNYFEGQILKFRESNGDG